MKPILINFPPLGDDRGHLVAVEAEKSIPFPIRRVYYIFDTKGGVERGFHAHKALKQVAIAVIGSCEMVLNDGASTETVVLDSPTKGVYIDHGVWRVMRNFSSDCVLLIFADQHYDESDYIRNYEEFTKWIAK